MTYEEKMLQVMARFRGQALDAATLAAMEAACAAEVWNHLPKPVLRSWRLHLAASDALPSQIELRPEHIGLGTAAELESALRSPFQENPPEPSGGFGVSSHLTGNIASDKVASSVPAQPAPSAEPAARDMRFEPGRIQFQVGAPPPAAAKTEATATATGSSLGAEIQAQARELGITLNPGGSLLTAFLEALTVAAEHKARADHLEQKLAAITAALK